MLQIFVCSTACLRRFVTKKYTNILKFSMGQFFLCELNMHYLLIFTEALWIWLSPLRYEKPKIRICLQPVLVLFLFYSCEYLRAQFWLWYYWSAYSKACLWPSGNFSNHNLLSCTACCPVLLPSLATLYFIQSLCFWN